MKKILIGIFSIILGFVGFGFCGDFTINYSDYNVVGNYAVVYLPVISCSQDFSLTVFDTDNDNTTINLCYVNTSEGTTNCIFGNYGNFSFSGNSLVYTLNYSDISSSVSNFCSIASINFYGFRSFSSAVYSSPLIQGGGSSSSDIDVYYNNGNSVENITCDGTQAISIDGLSTITSTNTFTPYFNIDYTDENNQKLTESYSKDILYLENGQFKKTYTGNNDWILTVQGNNSENQFSGYLPTFDITGGIEEVSESGNIFNNFAENSVKFTLSNIPSYIQYVILLLLLFFILGFIRKFRRK